MKDNLPLTKLLNRYALGLINKKDLEGHIFKFILDNYQQFHPYGWEKEDYMDYLCWFYPRISRAIENYQDTGASFDAYINSLVRWGSKEYRARETDHHVAEYACWKAKALDDAACHEEEDVYIEQEPVFDSVSNPRQVLVLLLKSYHYMSSDFLDRISPALNIDKEKLRQLVEELRKLRLQREENIRELQERIHSQFYRCIVFEKKLKLAPPNSVRHEKMKRRLDRGRKRLESMRKRLSGMKIGASNRQVAQILESAKGTIDAHLYTVKAKGEKYGDESEVEDTEQ
ncbi:hypothetical protein [Treponema primitia]|uniref:hypothetical protein n=1 Tax=Treponema primitia TaxID=88058 RepID=UPI000255530B|nr:hypothetical protein [Treponema primitia]